VKLAIRILSVIANSGGCERSFSDFGITHTKIRNKLSAEKVHKTSVVKMDLRRAHITAGLTTKRRKRKFGQDNESLQDESSDLNSPVHGEDGENVDVRDLMNDLIRDSNVDDRNDDPIPTVAVPSSLPRSRTATQRRIPLASLFAFAESASTGCLEFYWKGGLKNMEREVAAYDLIQEEENTGVLMDGTMGHINTSLDSGSSMPS
jgi:hypothetical protein